MILLWLPRLKTLLGSGQFGEVYKATWSVNENLQTLELAVKTLKSGASEEDKVKFLQEAAIMGQFSHTNVIKMYGVVTIGEPVSLCFKIHTCECCCCIFSIFCTKC